MKILQPTHRSVHKTLLFYQNFQRRKKLTVLNLTSFESFKTQSRIQRMALQPRSTLSTQVKLKRKESSSRPQEKNKLWLSCWLKKKMRT